MLLLESERTGLRPEMGRVVGTEYDVQVALLVRAPDGEDEAGAAAADLLEALISSESMEWVTWPAADARARVCVHGLSVVEHMPSFLLQLLALCDRAGAAILDLELKRVAP